MRNPAGRASRPGVCGRYPPTSLRVGSCGVIGASVRSATPASRSVLSSWWTCNPWWDTPIVCVSGDASSQRTVTSACRWVATPISHPMSRAGCVTRARSGLIRAQREFMFWTAYRHHLQATVMASGGQNAPHTYRYLRICTFCTNPINAKKVTMPEPPYEMNGNGRPVIGMRPTVIAMFWKICQSSIVNTPTQM